MVKSFIVAVCAVGGATVLLSAQTPAFEVATVKVNRSGEQSASIRMMPGGRFAVTNNTLRNMVRNAYRLQTYQLTGGPAWIDQERFDVIGKAEGSDLTPDAIMQMFKTLLADRFKLVVHEEPREMPIYALRVARADRRLGPALRLSTCTPVPPSPATAPPPAGADVSCGGVRNAFGTSTARGIPLAQFAATLPQFVGRFVSDRSDLTGLYDLDLRWTPENLPARAPGTPADAPLRVNGQDIDPNGPSIFTALEEQLGLKLEAGRGPVTVLVVDSAERPTED